MIYFHSMVGFSHNFDNSLVLENMNSWVYINIKIGPLDCKELHYTEENWCDFSSTKLC